MLSHAKKAGPSAQVGSTVDGHQARYAAVCVDVCIA